MSFFSEHCYGLLGTLEGNSVAWNWIVGDVSWGFLLALFVISSTVASGKVSFLLFLSILKVVISRLFCSGPLFSFTKWLHL